jgi:histidine phosphotransferase ChpT
MSQPAALLDPYVIELLASRMCHDVISPVGAINNGLELLEEMGVEAGADAIQLIGKSAEQANRRLRLFRYTYGAAGSRDQIDSKDMRRTAFEYFEGTRAVLEWPEHEPSWPIGDSAPRGFMKGALNLIVLGGEMVTKQGLIKLRQITPEKPDLEIQVSGDGAAFREGMEAALQGTVEPTDLDARLVHAYVTGVLIRHYNYKLTVTKQADGKVIFGLQA